MPVFLSHDQINKTEWDRCVQKSANPLLYAMSWYLDVVAPNWCAVIDKNGEKYTAVLPLPMKWRFGFGFAYQPPFTQQLGIFSVEEDAGKLLRTFLEAIPANIKHLSLSLHTQMQVDDEKLPAGFSVTKRLTHHLPLNKPYEVLLKNYDANLRRRLKKELPAGCIISEASSLADTIALFRRGTGKSISDLKGKHYTTLSNLTTKLLELQHAIILELRCNNELLSGMLVLQSGNKLITLFTANSDQARKLHANAHLLHYLIKENAGTDMILDFEGGNIPSIGQFFRNFGAAPAAFVSLKMNKLPWPVSKLFS